MSNKPKGYFDFILAADCETSGLFFNQDDPSFDSKTGEYCQSVSWGLVVADANTLKPVEELYLEIKWDKKSFWSPKAEAVHSLSKEYLDANGVESWEAVERIGNLILKYWGPKNSVRLLGHNVATFDLWFLKRLMRSEGIELSFGNRHVDTSSISFATIGAYNSDDLFEQIGLPLRDPNKHNALTDAKYALEAARRIKSLWNQFVNPHI